MKRTELDKNKVEASKQKILAAALKVASLQGGWSKLTRESVAREAQCADALISRYFGTMVTFKRTIMRAAIKGRILPIIAQGLAAGDTYAKKADPELRAAAIQSLVK